MRRMRMTLAMLLSIAAGWGVTAYGDCQGMSGGSSSTARGNTVQSWDPNEMKGPLGVGEKRYVANGERLDYAIYFENKAEATAAACAVVVTLPIDAGLDPESLEFGDVAFGPYVEQGLVGKTVDTATECTKALANSASSVKTSVRRLANGDIQWKLVIYDPTTPDHLPADPTAGFLPPNDPETHCGEGYVRYSIKVKDVAVIGSKINASATIVFDANPPIETDPAWWNTVGEIQTLTLALGDGTETNLTLVAGEKFGELPVPTKKGYAFKGWFFGPNGTGGEVTADTLAPSGLENIYADWEANAVNIWVDGVKNTRHYDEMATFATEASVTNGHTNVVCVGWIGTGDVPAAGTSNAVMFTVTQESTLRWLYETNYWVSATADAGGNLMLKDAAGAALPTNELWAAAGTNLTAEATANEGSAFARWVDAETGEELGQRGALTLPVNRPWLVRAELTNLMFAVRFELGEYGSRTGGGALEQTVAWGEAAIAPTVAAEDGYVFSGWSMAFDCVTQDLVVTARYATGGYAITYENTMGCFNPNPPAYTVEDAVTFSALTNPPGWRFVGWAPAEIVRGSAGDTNVVAQWEQLVEVADVGKWANLDLVEDLGVEIPEDVDYAAGDKVTVKVEGLAKGLKVVATPVYEDPTAKKKVIKDYIYSIEGVPTEAVDFDTQTMYARVTVTYKDKTKGDKGKAELLQPVGLSITTPEPSVLTEGVLNEAYGPVDIAALWLEVADAKENPKEWSFKGWPAGVKYTTKDVTKKNKDKSVTTNAVAYSVYGTPTKAGEFKITATHKYKIGKTTVSETFSAVLTVWGDDGATDFRYTDQAYVATETKTLGATFKSFSGLPTGVKWTAKIVAANEKKGTPEYPAYSLYGTPTKAGVFAVTATKVDPDDPAGKKTVKETFLWKVTPGENDGILGGISWKAEDSAITVMQGVIQGWPVAMPEGAKVTASGLPSGLKLAQDKTTKAWTISGTPTKAGNYVVTLKTVRNGVTVTERISVIVTANEWTGNWYGVQADFGHKDTLKAEVTVKANGTVKLVLTEASTNYNAKGVVQSAVRKTTVTVKNLDANGTTATLTLPKNKKDPSSENRVCLLDFEEAALTVNGELRMFLSEADGEAPWPDVTTVVLEETAGGETNAYGYVTATYNAKKGSFALAGKLWDGASVKGTCSALADGVISPVLVTDKAKNAVSITLGSVDGDLLVFVRENGELVPVGRKLPNGYEPLSGSFAAADLKSKKFNMMSDAKTLVVAMPGVVGSAPRADRGGRGATALPSVLVLEIPAKSLSASVSAQGLVKFTVTDADGWKWACELLPVRRDGEGAVATQGDDLQFRGIATGTKKNEPTQVCPVWAE